MAECENPHRRKLTNLCEGRRLEARFCATSRRVKAKTEFGGKGRKKPVTGNTCVLQALSCHMNTFPSQDIVAKGKLYGNVMTVIKLITGCSD